MSVAMSRMQGLPWVRLRGLARLFTGPSMDAEDYWLLAKNTTCKKYLLHLPKFNDFTTKLPKIDPSYQDCLATSITSYILNLTIIQAADKSPFRNKAHPPNHFFILSYLCLSVVISHLSQWSFQEPTTQAMAPRVYLFSFISNPLHNNTWTHCECCTSSQHHMTLTCHTDSPTPRKIWTSSMRQFTNHTLVYKKNVK